jgi:hypothetical protein
VKEKLRKKVSTHGDIRAIVTEKTTDYTESDDLTEKVYRMGENLSKSMPKHTFGLKELGWLFIKGSSVERAKTFDVETAALSRLTGYCTFEAAIEMVEQLRRKIYVEFGREMPGTRQDLKDTNA